MQQSLFRDQAIKHQNARLNGDVLVVPPLSYVVITLVLVVWCLALIAWLVNSQYARKVTVSGWLEPAMGVINLYPKDGTGRINKVFVTEGQSVKVGMPLLEVQGDRTLPDGQSLEEQMRAEYLSQQQFLRERLSGLGSIHAMQLADLEHQQAASEQDLVKLADQIATLKVRMDMLEKRSEHYHAMQQRGHVSNVETESVYEQTLALKNEYQALERERIQLKNQIRHFDTQRQQIPAEQLAERNELKTKVSALNQKLSELSSQQAYVLKAGVDGTVTNLQARRGQHTQLNKPLLTLLPGADAIVANILVPVSAAGFVTENQTLDIRYDAFPYQKFGLYKGTITEVSKSVLLPHEIQGNPLQITEPVFLVRAMLKTPFVKAYGDDISLKPGMTLTADIQQGDRSLLEWLLEPILTLRGAI